MLNAPDKLLRVGLVINPLAGVGGPAGLKGSDGVYDEALARGSESRVVERVSQCLAQVDSTAIDWVAAKGDMGGTVLGALGIDYKVIGWQMPERITSGSDTRDVVRLLSQERIDLLLFAGGDGTARDVFDGFSNTPAVLGIPCGVKMHSGVFATSPGAAASLVNKLLEGELLSIIDAEVRDIDEASFREGVVKTRFYGELPVIDDVRYMQQTKVGGREVEELVLEEIAADFREHLEPGVTYIMGSGSTIAAVMASMSLNPTLLGIDVVRDGKLVAADVSEKALLALLDEGEDARIVVTVIGGQGHIFGRGNQQLSPTVIRKVGAENIVVLASKSKLAELDHRPLLVDTGDADLDDELAGMRAIVTGYEDRVIYRVT